MAPLLSAAPMSFNANALPGLWDIPASQSLSAINDDDFLAILQGQFTGSAPTSDPYKPPHLDLSIPGPNSANPQSLSLLPSSVTDTPPLSDDNSPSPPSTHNDNDGETQRHGRTRSTTFDDDALKRKASDEDLDEEPSHKNLNIDGGQHTFIYRASSTTNIITAFRSQEEHCAESS